MTTVVNFGDERLPERFWSKVVPCPMSGCWLWTAALSHGYGVYGVRNPIVQRAYVVTFETLVGHRTKGLELDHLCRVRCCVNPAHLEQVTHAENVRRGAGGTNNAIKTHCPRGHAYDAANTWIDTYGKRRCRACIANQSSERHYRKKLAA